MTKTKTKTKDEAPDRFRRIPVTNEWLEDGDLPAAPNQRYDWTGIGDKAITKPGTWLLVDEDGAKSTATNITGRRIAALNTERFADYTFRGRCVGMHRAQDGSLRAQIWIKAEHVGLRP